MEEEFKETDIEEPIEPELTPAHAKFEQFWAELEGIIQFLNDTNKKSHITGFSAPTIDLYIQWRILSELKEVKISQESMKRQIKSLKENLEG